MLSFKQQLMKRIEFNEAAIRQAELEHTENLKVARTYEELGLLYGDVAMWDKSNSCLEHAIAFFRRSPEMNEDLATALSGLGRVHISMGRFRDSEREEEEALRVRESMGDRFQIARSKDDLAELYLAQQKFAKAKSAAQEAIDVFAVDARADSFDRISARYALALALCASKDCPSAVAPLKEAIKEARDNFQMRDFPFGLGEFLLGYAYWKSGNLTDADVNMKQGIDLINGQLGWTHPICLAALRHYAQFLRATRRIDEAEETERRIRQAAVGCGCECAFEPGRFWACGIALGCWGLVR